MTGALIVFAREPRPGNVKTRLAATVGESAAAEIYAQLLSRSLSIAERSRFSTRYLFAADSEEIDYFAGRLANDMWQVRVQCQGDIGQRMEHAIALVLRRHQFVVLVGSDVADSKTMDLDHAWKLLSSRSKSAVVGPSVDGGYWLIGLRKTEPMIFRGIPWSTDRVFRTTIARMDGLGLEVNCLVPRHDVDEAADLCYVV
ncbi:MAG TPA: hypothetical protein DGR97_04810 [Gammaproteobacteria bacterium]|nr:hypothetical protein [Gammaproteobacteria bacterium]